MSAADTALDQFIQHLQHCNPHQPEFIQAVCEMADSVMPLVLEHEDYRRARILERLCEPDRVVSFRVTWEDDRGEVRVNRAWRVQFNHAIGPYKGGLRFQNSVTEGILKFLGFEQTLKNSLTGLPMGGAKGGANIDPRSLSERELMRFCQSLMTELYRHIGPDTDVPAGDMGVGGREIGYLFGQYARIVNDFHGVLTGKGLAFGGSPVRTEATGYGCVYFCRQMLEHHGEGLADKRVVISGAGNVALHAAAKALEMGARVLTLSDSGGFIHCPHGLDEQTLATAMDIKLKGRGRLAELAERCAGIDYHDGKTPWGVACDIALPCATQNELDADAARRLADNGVRAVCEGANMPVTREAIRVLADTGVLFAPGKAANAGGVAVSGLEQSQNRTHLSWRSEEVDRQLREIMAAIHRRCVAASPRQDPVDYGAGANIAGFQRVAEAMLAYGIV